MYLGIQELGWSRDREHKRRDKDEGMRKEKRDESRKAGLHYRLLKAMRVIRIIVVRQARL